jgi:hypothetical protein
MTTEADRQNFSADLQMGTEVSISILGTQWVALDDVLWNRVLENF